MDHLPVFLDLRNRLTVVVGGGAVAARKVEMLLKAGARVRVVAPELDTEIALYRDAGRIEFDGRIYSGRFSIPAHHGNEGRSGPNQTKCWAQLDVPGILGLARGNRESQASGNR